MIKKKAASRIRLQQNTVKTVNRNSIINFYFVTAVYSLYDICMARQMIKTTIETMFFRHEEHDFEKKNMWEI